MIVIVCDCEPSVFSAPPTSSTSSIRFARSSSSKRPARSNAAWAWDQR